MTTAREKAEAFAASCLYGADNSDAITHAARQLLAIVDQRFAELREKESAAPRPATAEAWEPTDEQIAAVVRAAMRDNEQQIEVLKNQWRNNWKSATFGLIAGYRIAKETPCNQ